MPPVAHSGPPSRARPARPRSGAFATSLLVLALAGVSPAHATWIAWPPGVKWPQSAPGVPPSPPLIATAATETPADTVADAPRPWSPGDAAFVLAPAPEDSVVLRVAPFSPESLWLEAARLAGDARVVVLDTRVDGGGTWVLVQAWIPGEPRGWVHAKQLGREPRWSTLDIPAEAELQPWPYAGLQLPAERLPGVPDGAGYGLAIGIGAAAIAGAGGQSVASEYDVGGLAAEVEGLDFRRGSVVVAAGMGYRRFNGSPAREYVYADRIVVPNRSRSTLGYALLEAGGRWAFASGWRLGLLAGPAVGLVHEDMDARMLSPTSRLPMGLTSSSLDRLTAGGGGTAWIGRALQAPAELGLRVRLLALAWKGLHELPLALDRVDHGLWHADLALTVTLANP